MSNLKLSEKRQSTHKELTVDVVEGFERLDNHLLDRRPPKIQWLDGFDNKEDHIKIKYLKSLASTMNNAAKLAQDERDLLVPLLVKKDEQLGVISRQMAQNNDTIQNQVTRMNEQRQGFNREVSRLNKIIRELKNDNRNLKKEAKKEG